MVLQKRTRVVHGAMGAAAKKVSTEKKYSTQNMYSPRSRCSFQDTNEQFEVSSIPLTNFAVIIHM